MPPAMFWLSVRVRGCKHEDHAERAEGQGAVVGGCVRRDTERMVVRHKRSKVAQAKDRCKLTALSDVLLDTCAMALGRRIQDDSERNSNRAGEEPCEP